MKTKLKAFNNDFRVLLIKDFPFDLAQQCLDTTGRPVLTRAVLQCLRDYFALKKLFSAERQKRQDLQSDLDLILGYFRSESDLKEKRDTVLKILSDPNRFYLHGD